MRTFIRKSGIFAVVLLIANLFFVSVTFGQTTTLYLQNTGGTGTFVRDLSLTQGSAGTIVSSGTTSQTFSERLGFFISNSSLTLPISGNSFPVSVNMQAYSSTNLAFQFRLQRVNSSGVVQDNTGYSTAFTTASTGNKTATLSFPSAQTWAPTDRLYLSIEVRSTNATATNRTITVNTGTANSIVQYCTSPTAYAVTGGGTYCSGGAGLAVGLSNSQTGVSYQLYRDAIAVGSSQAGTNGSALNFGNQTVAGTYTVVASTSIGGCTTNMLGNAIVSINPLPTANTGVALSAICQGGTSAALGGSVGGSATGGTWSDGGIGGIFNPSDTDLNATWTPPSGYSGTATLTLTTSGGACGTTTASKSQVVNAQPTALAGGSQTICANQTATISGTATNGTIVWTVGGGATTGTLDNPNIQSPVFTPDQFFIGTATLTMTVSNSPCASATATYTVIVNAAATVDPGADSTICMSTPAAIPLSGIIDGTATIGTWSDGGLGGTFNPNNSESATSYTPTQAEIDAGSVILTLTSNDPGLPCPGAVSKSRTITFKKAPTATAGGSTSICPGGSAIVSGATSSNGTIVWTHNGSGSLTNANTLTPTYTSVVGEAGSTVTLTLTVSNSPCPDATATYTIVVNPLPDSKNLLGTATICSGATTDIQVVDSQYDFTLGIQYQLRNNSNNAAVGIPVSGTGATINLPTGILTNNTANPITFTFNVLATNLNTNCSVQMANVVTITVNPAPLNRTITGPGAAICTGSTATITVGTATASVNGTTYQLRNNADNSNIVGSAVTISNTSTASFGLSTLALATTTTFNVLATINATGCSAQMSGTPTVTVNQLISNNTITSDQSICSGTAPTALVGSTPTGGNGTYTYLWEQSTNNETGTGTWANASITNGASSRTLQNYTPPQSPPSTVTTWYRRTVTSAPCGASISPAVKITVNPLPTIYAVTGGGAYCAGGAGMPIGLSNSQTGVNYQLYLGAIPDGTPVVGTGTAISFGNKTAAGAYTVVATDANFTTNCTSNMTGSATIIVNPVPETTGAAICPGGSSELTSFCPNPTVNVGPKSPGTGASASGVGTAWTNPGNIISDNASYATASATAFGGGIATNSLQATNFDFSTIPNSATILGIQVAIKRFSSADSPSDNVKDNILSLLKAGVVTGSNYAVTATNWPITNTTVVSYGGASDLWGTTWTPAEIKATNFGVALTVFISKSGFNAPTASVDNMRITVYYLANGILNWYTAAAGGTAIGTGSPFNPVGVLNSGLANTNTAGTTPFYAECSSVPGCRTLTNFVVHPLPTVTCPANSTVCVNTVPYALTGGLPLGGTFSGTGVSANNFDPATAGVGPHIITYTYTDGNGCTNTCSFTITVNATVVASGTQVNVLCNGASTGSIDLTVTGGSGSYTYLWSNGETTEDISGLAASVIPYSVTITEPNGCAITGTTSFTITEPPVVAASGTQIDVLCKGASTGSINLTVTGGSGSYTYLWSNGATTEDISGLAASVIPYSVMITESNSCMVTGTTSFTITEPTTALSISITEPHTDVDCFGNHTGSAKVEATGGISPYTYLWNDAGSQGTATATNLAAGDYMVTVTDANGCISTAAVTITEPVILEATITGQTNVGCFGANTGSATVEASGGTAPYEYLWDDLGAQTTAIATGLISGTYHVTITDAHGCTATATVIITQSNATVASGTQANVSCKGGTNGSIDLSVIGGSGSYTYLWDDNVTTTQDRTGLAQGTYSVTVTDTGGCTVTGTTSFTITEPDLIVASGTQVDVLCKGGFTGSIDLSVTGGSGSYTYLWSNGATTQDISGLAAGTYSVTITESNSCTITGTTSFTIIEPTEALSASITAQTDVDCFANSNGSATVTASGGTPPYNYLWDDGSAQTDAMAINLASGIYHITVTDDHGCTTTATATIITDDHELPTVVTQNILVELNPTSVSITVPQINNGSHDNCGIQSITVSPSSFTCANVGPNTVTLTVTDTNGNVNTGTATVTVKDALLPVISGMPANKTVNLSGGNCSALVGWIAPTATDNCGMLSLLSSDETYNENGNTLLGVGVHTITYTATDVNGNIATASFTVTVVDHTAPTITNCPSNITVNTDNNICGARVFYVQPNVNDCNGASLAINNNNYLSGNIFPLGTTTVTWTATDASNNLTSCSFNVTVEDHQAPVANVASLPTLTGECSVTVPTPTASDNCDGTINGVPNGPTTYSTTGTYTILWTYTDSHGNSSSQNQTVTVNATPPVINTQPISLSKCEGQSATFSVTAATAIGYQWQLYNGSVWNDLASETNSTLNIASVTPSMNGNNYRVIVSGTCGSIPSDAVTLSVYSLPIASNQPDQTLCNTSTFNMTQSGSGTWTLVSGTATITTAGSPTTTITGVAPGTSATVRWTITNGPCSAFDEVTVTNTVLPSVSDQANQTICNSSSFTMSQSAPSVGTGIWTLVSGSATITTDSSPTTTITGVPDGTSATLKWTVTNGSCSAFDEVTVTNAILPSVSDQANQNLCNNSSFTMTQSAPSIGAGIWTLIGGIATITNPSSPTTTITGVAVGTSAKVRWTVTSGSCSAFDDVMVTNTILPSVSNQPDQTLCNTSSFTMTQSVPSAGTGTWTLISGSATITTPGSATTTITGVAVGTSATVRWTVSNIDCSSFDEVTVTNSALSSVSDQPNQSLCNTSSFTMTQTGSGIWTLISGSATITTPSSPTSTITGVALGASATVRWTVGSGACSVFDDVTVTNTIAPAVSDQPNQTLCNAPTFTMTQSGSGIWTLVSGTATITTPGSPTTTITGVTAGTSATVRWTAGSGACTAFDDVTVTNNSVPLVSNQPNQTQCNNASFTMTQSGSGTWSLVSGTATITTPNSPTTTITGVALGANATVRWTVGSGACSAFDDVTVTNNSCTPFTASIAVSSPNAFCSGLTLTANPSVAGSYTYLWSPGGATTQSITLYNSASAGTYTVTVTKTSTSETAQANYNFQPQNIINDYTILGFSDVNLGDRNFVQTGSVGVTTSFGFAKIGTNSNVDGPGAFVKARFITVQSGSNVPTRIYSPVTVTLPTMQVNTSSTTGLSDLNIPNNTTVTKVGNYKNVTIGTNCNVTFTTGTIFGTVTIGKSSQVKFNANSTGILNVQSISLSDGTDPAPSKLIFSSDISVRVKNTFTIGKSSMVNTTGGYKAVFYIGGNEFHVLPGGNVTVNASVFAPNGTVKVEGDAIKNTFMKGFYIGSRVASTNKNIYWNQFDCLNPNAKPNVIESTDNIIAKVEQPLISPEQVPFEVKAYPNPTNYQFTIEIQGGSAEKVEVDLFDMQGRNIKHTESTNNLPIMFGEELPAATYIAIINQGGNRKTLKLIKK